MENEALRIACDAARTAGQAIMRIAKEHYQEAEVEADRKVLTLADLEADRILRETLTAAFPEDGWLSEETRSDASRLQASMVWIVDPLDGTREFVMHNPEFVVSVARVRDGKPILAVIYNPTTEDLYAAAQGQGTTLNGESVTCYDLAGTQATVDVSRSDIKKGFFADYEDKLSLNPCGSIAFKLARVAAGAVDATLSVTPKNEWDIAAGVLLVTEAGGKVTDLDGKPYCFNQEDTLVNGVVAASKPAYDIVWQVVEGMRK